MNIGELNERISILSFTNQSNLYQWELENNIWAKSEYTSKWNKFSNLGYAEKQVKFLIRKRNLSLHNLVLWNNRHCFITDIVDIDRTFYEVNTSLVDLKQCKIKRSTDILQLDEYNRPLKDTEDHTITFPSVIAEKYVKQTTEEPMSTIESIYILVTPKVINLINGEIVTIQDVDYEVLLSHTLDEYKNEYEIRVRNES